MGFLDNFLDKEKTANATIANPRKVFEDVLRQTSGSAYTRDIKYNIYYQIIAFYGADNGVGCSTIVANTALALAETGLTICVIDTSILAPVQDVLLNTNEAVESVDDNAEHLDWFDLPYTKKSPLHVSKYAKNISVLSFKGKRHGIIDFLSTNDSSTLVDIALSTLHNKFDLILIDCCHEMSAVNSACLQQAQQVIQVWNDSPVVVANMENFITNSITLSCPLDKMRYVVANKMSKDAMGNLDSLVSQYRCRLLATANLSEELYLINVTGKKLFRAESMDEQVIAFTDFIIRIACHILNIELDKKEEHKGTITSDEIMNGEVEGTYHKELKDFNEEFAEAHPDVQIDTNPMDYEEDSDMAVTEDEATAHEYGGVMEEDDVKEEELTDSNRNGVADIYEDPDKVEKRKGKKLFGKKKKK